MVNDLESSFYSTKLQITEIERVVDIYNNITLKIDAKSLIVKMKKIESLINLITTDKIFQVKNTLNFSNFNKTILQIKQALLFFSIDKISELQNLFDKAEQFLNFSINDLKSVESGTHHFYQKSEYLMQGYLS